VPRIQNLEALKGSNVARKKRTFEGVWAKFWVATLLCGNSIIDPEIIRLFFGLFWEIIFKDDQF
jgi:hypothetical protein